MIDDHIISKQDIAQYLPGPNTIETFFKKKIASSRLRLSPFAEILPYCMHISAQDMNHVLTHKVG